MKMPVNLAGSEPKACWLDLSEILIFASLTGQILSHDFSAL